MTFIFVQLKSIEKKTRKIIQQPHQMYGELGKEQN